MFMLHKSNNKQAKSGERIDFKFSQFKALQVPKRWDKLFVSIISVESGKTVAKSSKAISRNGTCQWTDTVSEPIWVLQDGQVSSKELQDCPYKLVVAMGSGRSGILGEALVNMATYMSSSDSNSVSFPLKNCNHGTILQLKIQCLTPRINLGDGESKETNSRKEDLKTNSQDAEIKSKETDNSFSNSARSYSSRDLSSTTNQEDHGLKGEGGVLQEASLCSSGSHHSYNSAESSMEKEGFVPSNNLSAEEHNLIARQDSISSQSSVPPGSSNADNASQSDNSSFKSRITHSENLSQNDSQEFAAQSLRILGSSKSLLEAAEDTIEELHSESKMWERNARKLMIDLDILRKEYTELSQNQVSLDMELSAACAERHGLQKEVEQLKMLLGQSMVQPAALEDSIFQDKGVTNYTKKLENEIKFLKESNANLTLQLNRSQESNVELVSVLQELEETVEKQKAEIEKLSTLQSEFSGMESSILVNVEKNQGLLFQMQQLQESEKNLQAKVQELEKALKEKTKNFENGSLNQENFLDIETEYKFKLSIKEKEIVSLKAKLSETLKQNQHSAEMESNGRGDAILIREIESLKAKLQELEFDCQELTDENLDLLVKLKEMKNNSTEGSASFTNSRFEESDQESQIHDLEEKTRKKVFKEIEVDHILSIREVDNLKFELEGKVAELSKELDGKRKVIESLEAGLLSKEDEIGDLQRYQRELEDRVYVLRKEKDKREEHVEIASRESDIATKCLNDLRKELSVLSSSLGTHVSAYKILEKKSSELENEKHELEIHLLELRQENEELSASICGLEAQKRNLADKKQLMALKLQDSETDIVNLQHEIVGLRNELETQKIDAKKKLEEMHNQLSEAEEELDNLRSANPKLQAAADSLMKECSSLQKSIEKLKRQKLEVQEHCHHLEMKLKESHQNFADCSKRVNVLQENICSLLEDSATKERSLTSELDVLLKENEKQNKKLSILNQIESELKTTQIESKKKIQGLIDELASSKQDQELLKAENGKILNLLENYRSCEEKFKTTLNDVELKLTVSEYEKQQLIEEYSNLKTQLLKIRPLQDEVLALKKEVNAIKSEKEKLESEFNLKAEECKELKLEKNLFIDKITDLQKAVSELEECREDNIALEERLQRLENDLTMKEAVCQEAAEVKNELSLIKRANKQLQQQMQQLEEEKEKCTIRAQNLEEELISMKEKQRNSRDSRSANSPNNQHQRELLEDELSRSKEANNAYKVQVKRLTSEVLRKGRTGSPRKSKAESEFVPKDKFERTKSSLETELRDLRERYFNMSLKYAEVEAQREELVMKLKAANNGKRWF